MAPIFFQNSNLKNIAASAFLCYYLIIKNRLLIFIIILIIALLALGFLLFVGFESSPPEQARPASFDECAALGYPIAESYPRQCRTPDGQTFTEDIGNELEKQNLIRIDNPRPNQEIASPLAIEGQARGYWFFEASFPVKLLDQEGNIIAATIATAQEEWMTEDFVPFSATLEFEMPQDKRGLLLLEKDNPSGLPEHDDELRVPIWFKK